MQDELRLKKSILSSDLFITLYETIKLFFQVYKTNITQKKRINF